MSLYGSMVTAISGLTAQSRALGHVADNVANSQTTGYKRVDTSFEDYVTNSTQRLHESGSVVARPDYTNSLQGSIAQSDNTLALAISGQGFFAVAQPAGTDAQGATEFSKSTLYTRAGDFGLNNEGYLVNNQGYYLKGWPANAAGTLNRTDLTTLRIDQSVFDPVATGSVGLSANLPADAATGTAVTSQVQIYDALGRQHAVSLNYTKGTGDAWQLAVSIPGTTPPTPVGTIDLNFGAGAGVPPGTLGSFSGATGLTGSGGGAGDPAQVGFSIDFGQGPQNISLDLGSFGSSQGLTQFSGTEYEVGSLTQNGIPRGSFSSVSIKENGDVAVNYDNGQSRTVARVPIVSFADPDRLQRADGQAFLATVESGEPLAADINNNGAGKLVTSALESSNVDIASEFSKLILAQRAYTANTKIVTTTDQMLQDTINMTR
ncbi:flagellar hook protein FlgE [Roseomonas sp. BN140053]|uniref:flagellar hook protein FlgE n=1 Tax=Roseomonas sp. BN140053 TaxID=3391898 RepID=UPI0039E95E97